MIGSMAKRSDFAQKLLDDLRLRKEKLGYVTSSGHQSSAPPPSAESHGNSLVSTRRTGESMKKNTGSKSLVGRQVTGIWFSTKRNKAVVPEFAEKQIVPAGTVTNIHNSVDVSMALALALSASGKLHYVAKFGNELIPQNESIYYGETSNQQLLHRMKHHAKQYPFLSNLQMEEISKGVGNLNKILATGSDKSDFGKDSVQIGRALLKGTMDLEESLNMLVTLQEASDYMVGSHGRQVRVLTGKEEEEEEEEEESSNGRVNHKNLLYKTRISFDGSGKGKDDTSSQRIQCKSGHGDHIWNSNCKVKSSTSTDIKPLDTKSNSSGSLKMPSIIAKLMGLEELPTSKAEVNKVEAQKDSNPKKEMELGRSSKADAKVRKVMMISSQKHLQQKYDEQRILKEKLVHESEGKSSKERTNHIQKLRLSPNYAPNREMNMKIENVDMNQSLKERITKNNLGHSRDESGKGGEQRGKRSQPVAQEKRPNPETGQQRTKKKSPWSQNKMSGKTNAFLKQNDSGQDLFVDASNQNNTQVSQQKTTVPLSKTKCPLGAISKEKDHDRNNNQKVSRAMKDDDQKCTNSIGKTNTNQVSSDSSVLARNGGSGKVGDDMHQAKEHREMQIELKTPSDYLEPNRTADKRTDDVKPVQTRAQLMKPLHIPNAKKLGTENMKLLHKGENHSEFEESSLFIKTPNKKNQSSFLNGLEKRWKERTNKDGVTTVNLCETNSEQQLDKAVSSTLTSGESSANTARVKMLEEMSIEELKGNDLNNEASQQHQVSAIVDSEPQPSNLVEMQQEGATCDRNHDNCNLLKLQAEANAQGSLSKAEYLLKQLLINNQHFLNSAQSLFKIKIPVGALQDNEKYPKEGNMHLLDCGCELVRRKGKREGIHAIAGHYAASRVRHLNVLVKELNDDIESLKFLSMSDDSSEEFLHMMIERDIENKRPDANCMWDIGWSRSLVASLEKEEIVRNLEKHVLGGLISELVSESVSRNS